MWYHPWLCIHIWSQAYIVLVSSDVIKRYRGLSLYLSQRNSQGGLHYPERNEPTPQLPRSVLKVVSLLSLLEKCPQPEAAMNTWRWSYHPRIQRMETKPYKTNGWGRKQTQNNNSQQNYGSGPCCIETVNSIYTKKGLGLGHTCTAKWW